MTALITETDYQAQRRDLERAISYAEAERDHAVFKAQTGAGTADEAKKAKDHHDALKVKLADLDAAQRGAQVARQQNASAAKAAAHKSLQAEVEAFIKRRSTLVDAVAKHAEALAKAISDHQEATADVRKVLHAFVNKHGGSTVLDGINLNLQNGPSPYGIAACTMADHQVPASMLAGTVGAFRERSAADLEARFAEQLRGNVARLAPTEA